MGIESDFKDGGIVSFNRQDLLDDPLEGMDKGEVALVRFFRKLAEDSNIAGVAVSRIKLGGIYTHFFVKALTRDTAMRRTLHTTNDSFQFLESATQDTAGYGSYIGLGAKTFDEVEKGFRERWGTKDPSDPFHRSSCAEELDLMVIAKFE